jgi:predicted naringenin-chalcone synthase
MLAYYPPADTDETLGPPLSSRMQRYPEEALPLAKTACHHSIKNAGIDTDRVEHLVLVSCTGFSAPGVDIRLIDALGLSPSINRTTVGFMGCHGAMNGLRVARSLAAADAVTRNQKDGYVLLCCVELCTLHFQYGWDPQKIVANALFADGAAAVVGRFDDVKYSGEQIGDDAPPRVIANGSFLLPGTRDDMTWLIRDHGFEMTLSPRVPDLIEANLKSWMCDWLGEHGLTVDQIGGWAIHPGGPRVITAVEQAMGLPETAGDLSRQVLRDCGNMSSPTVLFILEKLMQQQMPRPYVGLAFGPGLTIEAVLIA